jgi:enamine deaminase RidA (YjgF/YER057c/UK114 family)
MIEDKLAQVGLSPPAASKPAFAYVPVTLHDGVAYVSGQLPKIDGEVRVLRQGRARGHARRGARGGAHLRCAGAGLPQGSAWRPVASAPGAEGDGLCRLGARQPKVVDAASELRAELLGERGRHARFAIGVAELPRDAAVEIEFVVAYAP